MRILEVEQRSDAWRTARAGLLTASRAGDVLNYRKDGKEGADRRDYRTELVAERLTGVPCESGFANADTERGVRLEPDAVRAYEVATGNIVTPVGFITHETLQVGYSPDGVIGDCIGLVEVKAPRPANHLSYVRARVVPSDHRPQCIHALWLTGAQWIDFISYSPIFPEGLQLFIVRLNRDDAEIAAYEAKALAFLGEVDRECADVRSLAL